MAARKRKFDPDWVDLELVANVIGEDAVYDLVDEINETVAGDFEITAAGTIRVSRERFDRALVEWVDFAKALATKAA